MCRSETPSKSRTVYGVPRRYDLGTLMVVFVAFAILFWFLQLLRASPAVTAVLLTFVVVVGLAQAMLFDGRAPRLASWAAGLLLGPAVIGVEAYFVGYRVSLPEMLLSAVFYSPIGYLTGAVIGGVFLISDWIRRFTQ